MKHSDPSLEHLRCLQADLDAIYEGDGKFKWSLLTFSAHLQLDFSKPSSSLDKDLVKGNAHATTEIISHLFDYLSGWELLDWNASNSSNGKRQSQLSKLLARAAFIRFSSMLDAFARLVLTHSGLKLGKRPPSLTQLLNTENPTKFRRRLVNHHKLLIDRLKIPVESVQEIRNALVHREVYLHLTQSSGSLMAFLMGSQWPGMETKIFTPALGVNYLYLEFDLYHSWILSEFLVAAESFTVAEAERLGLDILDRPKGGPLKVSPPIREHLNTLIDRASS